MGRSAPHLCRRQVLPVHDDRQPADAGGDPRAGVAQLPAHGRAHVRHSAAFRRPDDARGSEPAVPSVRAGIRDQGADVPIPHLASGRARRGADGRVGDSGGRAAEDGHLRLPAFLPSVVPGGERGIRAASHSARDHRHHLRGARRARSAGHEEAGRVLVRKPSGGGGARHLRFYAAGDDGRNGADDQPRALDGRAVPLRRYDLRAQAHARDLRVRRHLGGYAEIRRSADYGDPCVHRPAVYVRLRGRVAGVSRKLAREPLVCRVRRHGRHTLRLLHALDDSARASGRDHARTEPGSERSEPARDGRACAAGGGHDLDRRLSEAGSRPDRTQPGAHSGDRRPRAALCGGPRRPHVIPRSPRRGISARENVPDLRTAGSCPATRFLTPSSE